MKEEKFQAGSDTDILKRSRTKPVNETHLCVSQLLPKTPNATPIKHKTPKGYPINERSKVPLGFKHRNFQTIGKKKSSTGTRACVSRPFPKDPMRCLAPIKIRGPESFLTAAKSSTRVQVFCAIFFSELSGSESMLP